MITWSIFFLFTSILLTVSFLLLKWWKPFYSVSDAFFGLALVLTGRWKSLLWVRLLTSIGVGILLGVVQSRFGFVVWMGVGHVFGFRVWWLMEGPLLVFRVFSWVDGVSVRRSLGFRPLFFQVIPFFMSLSSSLLWESLFLLLDSWPVARNQFWIKMRGQQGVWKEEVRSADTG